MATNFDVTEFFMCLMDNANIQALVGTYEGDPAIMEEFPDTPSEAFINLCDDDLKYTYCPGTSNAISGVFYFNLKYVGTPKESRSEIRDKINILIKELKEFTGNCVSGIKIDARSNNLIDQQSERPYVAINARAYFR